MAITQAPDNVMLPGVWERYRQDNRICRLTFYSQAYLDDQEVYDAVDYLTIHARQEVSPENIEVLIPPREDLARTATEYARQRGVRTRIVMPLQEKLRNNDWLMTHLMCWYATHCVLLYSSDAKYQRFHQIDRYGAWHHFFQLAMNHRLKVRRADMERVRPYL